MAIAYSYDGALYLAVTRRCTLACVFCPKNHGRWVVAGNDMSADKEPDADTLLQAAMAKDPSKHREVAFVGLGEPTLRLPVVTKVGRILKEQGNHVRIVTDGLANLRFEDDITGDLVGAIDEVHVSLNAPDPETYARICPNKNGMCAHNAVCDFILRVQEKIPKVVATAIEMPGVDIPACRALATKLGVPLRVRPYFDPGSGNPHDDGAEV